MCEKCDITKRYNSHERDIGFVTVWIGLTCIYLLAVVAFRDIFKKVENENENVERCRLIETIHYLIVHTTRV